MRAFMDEMSQFGEQLKQDISLWPFPVRIIHKAETAFNKLGFLGNKNTYAELNIGVVWVVFAEGFSG